MKSLLLYISLSFCLCLGNIEAQIPSNVSVESFIDQLTSKVAKENLNFHQMQLVTPLALALGNAKVNLVPFLDEKIGETPVEVLSILVSLNDIVNQYNAHSFLDLKEVKRQISELSFYKNRDEKLPNVENISPSELLFAGSSVDMNLEGKFINVQEDDFHASIVLSTSIPSVSNTGIHSQRNSIVTIMPIEKKSDLIHFQLPLEYFTAYRKKIGLLYLNLDLGVPHKSEDSLQPRKVRYTLPFYLLPSSPGSMYLTYQQTSNSNKKETRKTRSFVQHSSNKYITENYYLPEEENEKIIFDSAKLIVEWSDGKKNRDWSFSKHKTSRGICFTVETVYNPVGISGKVNFHIEYEVEKSTTNTTQKYISVELDWNDYQRFEIGYGTKWKLEFTDYLGELYTYRQPISKEPLTISKSGKNLIVTTSGVEIVHKNRQP